MVEKLYLNKKLVDLYPNGVTRKIQIGKVGEIAARKSTHSYTTKLPNTANNIQVLDMLGVLGNTSRKPYERIVADYIVNGISLVADGYVKIKAKSGFFELVIYDGVIDLGERLKGKKIEDLQLDDLNHILTTQTYIDSFSNTEGYIYGIANFGLGTASVMQVETQAPSIYTHSLFRKIFEQNGLNLVGGFFTTNQNYLTEVVTPSKGYVINESAFSNDAKGGSNTNTLFDYQDSETTYLTFEDKFDLSNESLVGASIVSNEMLFSVAGVYKLDFNCTYNSYRTVLNIVFKINGIDRSGTSLFEEVSGGSKVFSVTFTVEVGDVVSIHLRGSSAYPEDDNDNFELNYSAQVNTLLYLQTGGQLITPTDFIGEMNQLVFIQDVIRRFGLILRPIRNSTDYEFKQLEAILQDRANAEDWTDKIYTIGKENYISGYSKTNYAKYNYPEEIVIPNNDGEMLIDNENASTEKTIFTSPFQIPILLGQYLAKDLYSIPIWETVDAVTELKETPLKIMKVSRYDVSFSAKLFSEVTPVSVTADVPFLSLIKMSMQFFLGNYYNSFQALIEDYNSTDFSLNLTTLDIFNLNFFKLKYIKQTGRYYYTDHIQHKPNKLTKAVLVEISEFPTNQPPLTIGNYSFDMNHGATRTITLANLMTGYFDAELDPPLKIKIINGFDTDLILKNNGVTITAETEINVEDLNLTVFDSLGGASGYSVAYEFTIADTGSGNYSSETGTLTANVLDFTNVAPVANAGSDQAKTLPPPEIPYSIFATLNGSASSDETGDIVSYVWAVITKPTNSNVSIATQDTTTPSASAEFTNDIYSAGTYVFELTVTDEFGLTDTDTMTIIVSNN